MQKVLWVNLSSEFRKSGVQIYNNHLKYIASKNIKIFNLNSNNTNKKYKFYEKNISKYFKILRICKRQNLKYTPEQQVKYDRLMQLRRERVKYFYDNDLVFKGPAKKLDKTNPKAKTP